MEERGSPAPGTRGLVESVLGPQPTDLQALLDSVPAYIWYKDQNNRILRLNRLAADSMGLRVEEAEGRSVYELYPDDAAQYYEADLEVIRTGEPKLGIVETLLTASGEKRWVRTDKIPYRSGEGRSSASSSSPSTSRNVCGPRRPCSAPTKSCSGASTSGRSSSPPQCRF